MSIWKVRSTLTSCGLFFAFHFLLLLHGHREVATVDALENALVFLSVGVEHLDVLTYEAVVLLRHLKGLSQSGGSYFQFVVFLVAAEVVFDVTAQGNAVFNPHSVSVVYLYYDAVVGAYLDVNKEILLAVKPLFNNTSYGVFTYHTLFIRIKNEELSRSPSFH